jgi:hypothetical protein
VLSHCSLCHSLDSGIETINKLVDAVRQNSSGTDAQSSTALLIAASEEQEQVFRTYTKTEMQHISTLLDELRAGFKQCVSMLRAPKSLRMRFSHVLTLQPALSLLHRRARHCQRSLHSTLANGGRVRYALATLRVVQRPCTRWPLTSSSLHHPAAPTPVLCVRRYEASAATNEQSILAAVADVSSSLQSWKSDLRVEGNAAELGSLSSEASMRHHADVATIRKDLPMLLPTVRLLIGILSGPANAERRNEVGGRGGVCE